ncbi:MAG: hypothetical protein LC804_21975 [Acidobacteria bacterium]|nr:hypothetical protein [Acidobacteriota bacterium]
MSHTWAEPPNRLEGRVTPMPPENRVRRHDRGHLSQPRAPKPLSADRQPASLFIRQSEPPAAQLSQERSILFDQVRDNLLLLVIQPAGQGHEEKPNGCHVNHGASLHQGLCVEP